MTITANTWRWLATPRGQEAISCAPRDHSPATIGRLRKRFDAEQTRAILEASAARTRGGSKLHPDLAARVLSDRAGMEMASSHRAAAHKASRFASRLGADASVADLCCGIGADSWGLQHTGLSVRGVDHDESRIVMYAHNLPECTAVLGDVLEALPSDADAFHLDPARRSAQARTRTLDEFQPSPAVWEQIIARIPDGAIKLNPGVPANLLPDGEVEIISESGTLTQAVLWTGRLAQGPARTATIINEQGAHSITGSPDRPDAQHPIGAYLGSLDPSVERADLVSSLLNRIPVRLVHPGTGLVTSEQAHPSPFVRWYRTLETLPWNPKSVRAALRALDAGIIEVRTRGGIVNTDETQRALRGSGGRADLSVFVYRFGDRVNAIIAQRLDAKGPADDSTPTGPDGGDDREPISNRP